MRSLGLLPVLVLCATAYGQKARPVDIPLREGAGAVHGRLKGLQEMDYEVEASGQRLSVAMTCSPIRTLSIRVYDPDGEQAPVHRDAPSRWTVALSKAGRYGITVYRTNRSAPASTYSLRITVH
jgi:hypothetical protein